MSARGLVARGVPALPKIFTYIVVLIILLSVIILGLAAYAESLSGTYYYESGVPGFLIFVVGPARNLPASNVLESNRVSSRSGRCSFTAACSLWQITHPNSITALAS